MSDNERCFKCGNCPTCHLPKSPNFFFGWEVDIPKGFPWVIVRGDEEHDELLELVQSIPKHYNYESLPCSMYESLLLHGWPKSRVRHDKVRYRGKWYSLKTDYLPYDHGDRLTLASPGMRLYLPVIYETDINTPKSLLYRGRYSLRHQALRGHHELRRQLKRGELHKAARELEKQMDKFSRVMERLRMGGSMTLAIKDPINSKSRNYKYQKRR